MSDLLQQILDELRAEFEGAGISDARHLADLAARRITKMIGGARVYLPKERALNTKARDEAIRRDYNGRNMAEIQRTYRVSRATVYRIINNRPR